MINTRQVDAAFRAIMLTGGMTRAAKLMSVTQPAVSRLIRDLQARLGLKLFDRRGTRLTPTGEAHSLYREVELSFIGFDRIHQAAIVCPSAAPARYALPSSACQQLNAPHRRAVLVDDDRVEGGMEMLQRLPIVAEPIADHDRATELEMAGATVLDLKPTEWRVNASARRTPVRRGVRRSCKALPSTRFVRNSPLTTSIATAGKVPGGGLAV